MNFVSRKTQRFGAKTEIPNTIHTDRQHRFIILNGLPKTNRKKVKQEEEIAPISDKTKDIAKRALTKIKFEIIAKKQAELAELDENHTAEYKRVIKTLTNNYRSQANGQFIVNYLKTLSFFANFEKNLGDVEEEALAELGKYVKLERFRPAEIIFRENDPSNNKFYVILKGSVSIVKQRDTNIFVRENVNDQIQVHAHKHHNHHTHHGHNEHHGHGTHAHIDLHGHDHHENTPSNARKTMNHLDGENTTKNHPKVGTINEM